MAIFLFALFVKTAPWGWDNTKLFIWAYFICLPFLWRDLIARWPWPVRYGTCFLLFASGFVCLIGGLEVGSPGYDIANRADLEAVANVVRELPIKERFAAFPTYNHPLLLDGRKVVIGYPGHLWTQGFDFAPVEQQLKTLMLGPRRLARARPGVARALPLLGRGGKERLRLKCAAVAGDGGDRRERLLGHDLRSRDAARGLPAISWGRSSNGCDRSRMS